jgi:hypothetical protein
MPFDWGLAGAGAAAGFDQLQERLREDRKVKLAQMKAESDIRLAEENSRVQREERQAQKELIEQNKKDKERNDIKDELLQYGPEDPIPDDLRQRAQKANVPVISKALPVSATQGISASNFGKLLTKPQIAPPEPNMTPVGGIAPDASTIAQPAPEQNMSPADVMPVAPEPQQQYFRPRNPAERAQQEQFQRQRDLAKNLKGTTDRQEASRMAIEAGVPYEKVDDVINAFMGREVKKTFTPEPAYQVVGKDGQPLPGVVSISEGLGYLDGKPLPAGTKLVRVPTPKDPLSQALAQIKLDEARNKQGMGAAILQGIKDGSIPPDSTGLTRQGVWADVLLAASKDKDPDFNLVKAQRDWKAVLRNVSSLNAPAQVKLRQSIDKTTHSLDRVQELADQWNSIGIGPLSRANLTAALQGYKGQNAQALATQLEGQITDTTFELANVYQGGGTPTDQAKALAAKNLAAWWARGTMDKMIQQARTNLGYQQTAMDHIMVGGNQPGEENRYAPKPAEEKKETPDERMKRLLKRATGQ